MSYTAGEEKTQGRFPGLPSSLSAEHFLMLCGQTVCVCVSGGRWGSRGVNEAFLVHALYLLLFPQKMKNNTQPRPLLACAFCLGLGLREPLTHDTIKGLCTAELELGIFVS